MRKEEPPFPNIKKAIDPTSSNSTVLRYVPFGLSRNRYAVQARRERYTACSKVQDSY